MLSYPSRKYCITNCLFNFVLIPVKLRLIPVITMNCSPHAATLYLMLPDFLKQLISPVFCSCCLREKSISSFYKFISFLLQLLFFLYFFHLFGSHLELFKNFNFFVIACLFPQVFSNNLHLLLLRCKPAGIVILLVLHRQLNSMIHKYWLQLKNHSLVTHQTL